MSRTANIKRIERIVPELELFHQIAIAYTNKPLTSNAELLTNKTNNEIEAITGVDSEAVCAAASFNFISKRYGCGTKKSILAIPEPVTPYLNAGAITTETDRTRYSSIDLQGNFNTVIKKVRLFAGLCGNGDKNFSGITVEISEGESAASVLSRLANEIITNYPNSSVKPVLANPSYTKYRGSVADLTALAAIPSPQQWDCALMSDIGAGPDFFIYKNGKWVKTFIGTTYATTTMLYLFQSHSGQKFNKEPIAFHFYDQNGNLIDVTTNIVTAGYGIVACDLKVGGVDANSADRCLAGIGDIDSTIFNDISLRLSDQERTWIYWNISLKENKDLLIPWIKNRYNLVSDVQIGKDLSGIFTFPVYEEITAGDGGANASLDQIYYDSNGQIDVSYQNNDQIQIVRFPTFDSADYFDSLRAKPLYAKGVITQGYGIINGLISRGAYQIASIQDEFINSEEVFYITRSGNIQNLATDTRFIRDGFLNFIRSNVLAPVYENLLSIKRSSNLVSTDIIDSNPNKYPFCFNEYVETSEYNGFVISSGRSLSNKESSLRKTNIQLIKLYVGWLAKFNTKPIITNKAQSEFTKIDIKDAIKDIVSALSSNQAKEDVFASQSPVLQSEFKSISDESIAISSEILNGANIYRLKFTIFPTNALEGLYIEIYN